MLYFGYEISHLSTLSPSVSALSRETESAEMWLRVSHLSAPRVFAADG